jgi:AmiR/NasT family two-component response regulator
MTMDEAFTALRAHARANHRHLSELAQAVVTGTEDVTALSERLPRRGSSD